MWRNRSITQLSFRLKWIASLDSHAKMSLKKLDLAKIAPISKVGCNNLKSVLTLVRTLN